MSRRIYRASAWLAAIIIVLALCLIFPSVAAFAELAARELRYLWWLILMAIIGIYFIFFFGRKRD